MNPNYFANVLVRFGHFCLVLALVALMGGHWAVLQTVAWTAMLADNLETESFEEAVKNTFSGKRPCKLCKSIASGKQEEKKSDLPEFAKKLEFVSERPAIIFSAPDTFTLAPEFLVRCPLRLHQPPLPPPRLFCA